MLANKTMITFFCDAGYKYLLIKFPDLYCQKSNKESMTDIFRSCAKVVHVARMFPDITSPKHVSPNMVCHPIRNIVRIDVCT